MSDDKKPPKPLEEPKVSVHVTPKDNENNEHKKAAKKVEKTLKENVEKAIEKNKSGGQEKQFKAAKDETDRAGEGTSKEKIKEIEVSVSGKDEKGDEEKRGYTVIPKEGKPTP